LFTLLLLTFTFSGMIMAQQMSDSQVIEYVKQAHSEGKSQNQITTELMRRGVTQEQAKRLQQQYEAQQGSVTVQNTFDAMENRQRTSDTDEGITTGTGVVTVPTRSKPRSEDQIFGHDIFTSYNLTFEPNINMATPQDYKLGPGDEVIIDVWGASETTIRQQISPEGSILVSNIGPVYLNGMTVREANAYLQREFSKIYAGISGNEPISQVKMTLGEIRSIQINIMGEVSVPGTYTLSSFSSVFHALYRAGGVNDIGSLRNIRVIRDGKPLVELDIYDFIMRGVLQDDVRLQEGDVIIVSPYQNLVKITGKVKRPMYYELKPEETIATLIKYGGDFTGDAYKKAVRIIRKSGGREYQVYNVDETDFSVFRMNDGDRLEVDSILDRFENRVEVRGAVYREGMYQVNGAVNTVKQLIQKAEGVRGDAFLNRAILDRENEDLTHEIISVDLRGILNGTVADIPLWRNDVLYIPSIHELQEEATVAIHGQVARPGTYLYADQTTIEDLVLRAGGLLEAASTSKVEVARRIKDPRSMATSNQISETYTFELKDGYVINKGADFYLEPFDEVYIRRSPAYHKQKNVVVGGEVLFEGSYALSRKNERLSDLIEKAGGLTPDAYIRGARLIRVMSEEEQKRKEDALRMARLSEKDSISLETLDVSNRYSVGIHLEKALQNPMSDHDMVLREGDILYVPEYINTVKINGAVMYPNTVLYTSGQSLRYYINQAGGFADSAKKRKVYVVYMNGTVSRVRSRNSNKIEPGCEIIVPSKEEKRRMSTAEILSISTSTASIATMIATMVNLFK
ncbi:MAG: SLBB domain-containing protein, partial [Bacteroides sp.]|nr:SLBB domain-containing protein [Bacteroides sp.]